MTLADFRRETAHMSGDTEILLAAVTENLVTAAMFVRDDLNPDDELYPQLAGHELILAEEAA